MLRLLEGEEDEEVEVVQLQLQPALPEVVVLQVLIGAGSRITRTKRWITC